MFLNKWALLHVICISEQNFNSLVNLEKSCHKPVHSLRLNDTFHIKNKWPCVPLMYSTNYVSHYRMLKYHHSLSLVTHARQSSSSPQSYLRFFFSCFLGRWCACGRRGVACGVLWSDPSSSLSSISCKQETNSHESLAYRIFRYFTTHV